MHPKPSTPVAVAPARRTSVRSTTATTTTATTIRSTMVKSGASVRGLQSTPSSPSNNVKSASRSSYSHSVFRRRRRWQFKQVLRLLNRVAVLAAALFYLSLAVRAMVASFTVLNEEITAVEPSIPYYTPLMPSAIGDTTIDQSPLVRDVLAGRTTPRHGTIYLSPSTVPGRINGSFAADACATRTDDTIYEITTDAFLRKMFDAVVRDAAYNVTFLPDLELIAPVVDCLSSFILLTDATSPTYFYLVRSSTNLSDIGLVSFRLSTQTYEIVEQSQHGPILYGTLAVIRDMRQKIQHYYVISLGYPFLILHFDVYTLLGQDAEFNWLLLKIGKANMTELPKVVATTCRLGFFLEDQTIQRSLTNTFFIVPDDPYDEIAWMDWKGVRIVYDAWAWVHVIHVFLALDVLVNVTVLSLISVRTAAKGKFWLGDAFVTVSMSIAYRGSLVLCSWVLSKFWVVREFVFAEAAVISEMSPYSNHPEILEIDLLTLYLSAVGLLGKAFKARIDPAFAVFSFAVGFAIRRTSLYWFPSLVEVLVKVGTEDYEAFLVNVNRFEPMKFANLHPMLPISARVFFSVMIPIFFTVGPFVVILSAVKITPYFLKSAQQQQNTSSTRRNSSMSARNVEHLNQSDKEIAIVRTQFELATGAKLEGQYGLVCDYKNYVHIKGLRYVTPDAVYSNGYVVANRKFLVQITDLRDILIMKLLRVRFRNVYIHDVDGFRVLEFSRLVFPSTLSFKDLAELSVIVLS